MHTASLGQGQGPAQHLEEMMCRTSGPQGWSGAHTHMGVSWLCMGKCVGVSGHASASPTHLFLIHILPHDAGEEAVLHDLLGILRATSKPAEDTGRGDRAITCLPRVGTSCQAPPHPPLGAASCQTALDSVVLQRCRDSTVGMCKGQ